MKKDKFKVIKISREVLYEFIYEKFIEEQSCYLDVDPCEVTNTFDIDFETGEFIFIAHKSEDENENIIPFPVQLDVKKLLKNMDDTTKTMFAENRYKEYTLEQLIQIQEDNR